ncbi:TadE family protein [Brachybacterium hainanense]|uniref:TadE family protein n=1 Tax=Brachybacterium hainanense TaxID=1541174 RepID=A0ABV6RC59_9MICO
MGEVSGDPMPVRRSADRGRSALRRGVRHRHRGGVAAALQREEGSAVAEFPLLAVLIVVIALAVIQGAVILHTRNTLIDASVQGAHHASLVGNTPEDGADRTRMLISQRLGRGIDARVTASQAPDGMIDVQVSATFPLVGLYGPAGAMTVDGRAIAEDRW